MARLLIISFDSVGDAELDKLALRPSFSALIKKSRLFRAVDSVFPTITYPVHASVVTGKPPRLHGISNNTEPWPGPYPKWLYEENHLRERTLWQAAAEKGLVTASVMWPLTGGAKTIRYNIPEIMKRLGESQLMLNLRLGSRLPQIREFLRHAHLLKGISQPALDSFTTACMVDFLRENKPELGLVHLTAYDSLCHIHGRNTLRSDTALDSLDENLGRLLEAANGMEIILFSDHAQLDFERQVKPEEVLRGLPTGGSFFECIGGSAFFHTQGAPKYAIAEVSKRVAALEGFARFLTAEEMQGSGHGDLSFGFALKPGYACGAHADTERGQHGYPVDWPDYNVFYLHHSETVTPECSYGGSLLDIAPLAAGILGVSL